MYPLTRQITYLCMIPCDLWAKNPLKSVGILSRGSEGPGFKSVPSRQFWPRVATKYKKKFQSKNVSSWHWFAKCYSQTNLQWLHFLLRLLLLACVWVSQQSSNPLCLGFILSSICLIPKVTSKQELLFINCKIHSRNRNQQMLWNSFKISLEFFFKPISTFSSLFKEIISSLLFFFQRKNSVLIGILFMFNSDGNKSWNS